jgi:hypothetical protein
MFWKKKLKLGDTYACQTGDYAGRMLIFIDKNNHEYGFLSIPTMENIWVPIDKFEFGVNNKIIEYVERVPKTVKVTASAQFRANKTII